MISRKSRVAWMHRVLLLSIAFACVFPLFVNLCQSFQAPAELYGNFHLFPRRFTLRQYERVLFYTPAFYVWFWNSLKTVGSILLINIPVSLLAGYGFSQFRFTGRRALFFLYILLMLLPFQATVVPQYLTLRFLGMLDTPAAVILPNAFGAFGSFLMTQYMKGLDRKILEAGRIDGLNEWNVFLRLMIPNCKPAISALVLLLFLDNWSMVEQVILFLQDLARFPLSTELRVENFGTEVQAAGVLFAIVPLLLYGYGQPELVQGIRLSSLKGRE